MQSHQSPSPSTPGLRPHGISAVKAPAQPVPPVQGQRRPIRKRVSLHQEVAVTLRQLIQQGGLPPGDKIPEAELCTQLQVSRTPMREALKLLAAEGWVELLLNRGARVSSVTVAETRDLFEVLAYLELLVGEQLSRRLSAADLKHLEQIHRKLQRLHQQRRRKEYTLLNQQFHKTLASLTGNRILASTYEELLMRASRARYLANLSTGRWDESMDEHELIMTALRNRDGTLGQRLSEHLQRTAEVVITALADLQSH